MLIVLERARREKMMAVIPRALTIAGSDSGGGAGIQADLKSFSAFGVYGMSALTAITAQNTLGVQAILELPLNLIEAQIDSVVEDIGVDATKTGMLSSAAIVEVVAAAVARHRIPNLVVDPVMVAKSGDTLLQEDAISALKTRLLPLATVLTPNLPEAEILTGRPVKSLDAMREAARSLHELGVRWVVVKGGHLDEEEDAIDLVYDGNAFTSLRSTRVATRNTHGTGCTFSAAITAGLARGRPVPEAIAGAKRYVSCAIEQSLALGRGHGPTNHLVGVTSQW
ncbi:MAG: bifunctional hydroxymethylpyrimidine kinase/phosphomethylpyrimidine kinase [Dehalococcoidia bacterium]